MHGYYSYGEEQPRRPLKTSETPKENIVEHGLQTLVKKKSEPKKCKSCGGFLKYNGLGSFVCSKCGTLTYNNYGKARDVLDTYGSLNLYELMDKTGLNRSEIKELLEEGSLSYSASGITLNL